MEQLGIRPVQLLIQAFNFAVMVFILSKLLYRPILRKIKERQDKIKEGLQLQVKMREEVEKIDKLKEEKIEEGRQEARRIIKEARQNAQKQAEKIIDTAKRQMKEEQVKTSRELKAAGQQLREEMRKEAVNLASLMTEALIKEVLKDEEKQQRILKTKFKEISQLKS